MIDQGELFQIPNPCRGICQVNNRGYCKGCLRSRTERFHWNEFSPYQQQLIINLCERRRLKIKASNLPHDILEDQEQSSSLRQTDLFLSDSLTNLDNPEQSSSIEESLSRQASLIESNETDDLSEKHIEKPIDVSVLALPSIDGLADNNVDDNRELKPELDNSDAQVNDKPKAATQPSLTETVDNNFNKKPNKKINPSHNINDQQDLF